MRGRLLLAAGLALAALIPTADQAQSLDQPTQAPSTLSGYDAQGRSGGIVVGYDIPGRLPLSPLVDVAVPDAQSSVAVGPSSAASASLGYPGPLVLGLDTVFAQFAGSKSPLPPYPFIVRAPSPSGTSVEDTTSLPGGRMEASADGGRSSAHAVLPAKATLPILGLGTVDAASETTVQGDKVTSHVRVEVDGVDIAGLISVQAVVTDLTVTSDGAKTTKDGETKVVGVRVLGREAIIDGGGIRFAKSTPSALPSSLAPLSDSLGSVLDGLGPITGGLRAIQAGDPTGLQKVLQEAGITVRLAAPRHDGTGGAASLDSAGLLIAFDAKLSATPLAQLLAVIPPLPDVQGLPLQPNDLIAAIQARQVGQIGIAAARASVNATAAAGGDGQPGASSSNVGGGGGSEFVAGVVPLFPVTPPGLADGNLVAPGPVRRSAVRLPLGPLVGWQLVLLGVAAAMVASTFTRKLPDLALASGAPPCTGIPPTKGRPS